MPEQPSGSGQSDSVTGGQLSTNSSSHLSPPSSSSPRPQDHTESDMQIRPRTHGSTPLEFLSNRHDCVVPPSPPSSPSESIPHSFSDELDRKPNHAFSSKEENNDRTSGSTFDSLGHSFPDTPDATPSSHASLQPGKGRPCAFKTLRAYVQSVVPDMEPIGAFGQQCGRTGRYILEDAVMELVGPQWSGVVLIDVKSSAFPSTGDQTVPHERFGSFASSSTHSSSTAPLCDLLPPRRTLLMKMGGAQSSSESMRALVLRILDHATEVLHVDSVIFALDRSAMEAEQLRSVVHGLCYVGASLIGRRGVRSGGTTKPSDHEECIHTPHNVPSHYVLLSMNV